MPTSWTNDTPISNTSWSNDTAISNTRWDWDVAENDISRGSVINSTHNFFLDGYSDISGWTLAADNTGVTSRIRFTSSPVLASWDTWATLGVYTGWLHLEHSRLDDEDIINTDVYNRTLFRVYDIDVGKPHVVSFHAEISSASIISTRIIIADGDDVTNQYLNFAFVTPSTIYTNTFIPTKAGMLDIRFTSRATIEASGITNQYLEIARFRIARTKPPLKNTTWAND